jgi:hypothetical protein
MKRFTKARSSSSSRSIQHGSSTNGINNLQSHFSFDLNNMQVKFRFIQMLDCEAVRQSKREGGFGYGKRRCRTCGPTWEQLRAFVFKLSNSRKIPDGEEVVNSERISSSNPCFTKSLFLGTVAGQQMPVENRRYSRRLFESFQ